MNNFLYILSRIILVGSIAIWSVHMVFVDLFKISLPVLLVAAVLFPLALIVLLSTTPSVSGIVKLLKWVIALTFGAMIAGVLWAFQVGAPGGTGAGMAGAILLMGSIGIGMVLIVIELIVLTIAEFFPRKPPTLKS